MDKPADLFDRDWEWSRLARFAADPHPGPTLGLISGRRRQGKSVLLRALCDAGGGFYWQAFEGSRNDLLGDLGRHLAAALGAPASLALPDWDAALTALAATTQRHPGIVALDELPYAMESAPELPSLLQRRLADRTSSPRWLVCGSALRVMGGLLSADAPLRGRASLELVVLPFDYRTARAFWGIADPHLALQVFAVTGGTPAYAREFVRADTPRDGADFDDWVCRTVLDPSVPLFREGRVLLAEEPSITDRGLYHGVLAAIATGDTSPSRIAARLGRGVTALSHVLGVLCDSGLVVRQADAFHARRATFEVGEPIVRFHHAILRPNASALDRPGRQAQVWASARDTFYAQVVGPVFEEVCRTWALRLASPDELGGVVASVQRGIVNDSSARAQHEVDVVARDPTGRILALGEARWGARLTPGDADRLRRIKSLLVRAGEDAEGARLLLFSGGEHAPDFGDVRVVTLATLYGDDPRAATG
jgi:uncharacterized protein